MVISLEISDEILSKLERTPGQFAQEMRLAAAMFWVQREQLSTGLGAKVAGIPYADFLQALADAKIEWAAVDLDELRREIARD